MVLPHTIFFQLLKHLSPLANTQKFLSTCPCRLGAGPQNESQMSVEEVDQSSHPHLYPPLAPEEADVGLEWMFLVLEVCFPCPQPAFPAC